MVLHNLSTIMLHVLSKTPLFYYPFYPLWSEFFQPTIFLFTLFFQCIDVTCNERTISMWFVSSIIQTCGSPERWLSCVSFFLIYLLRRIPHVVGESFFICRNAFLRSFGVGAYSRGVLILLLQLYLKVKSVACRQFFHILPFTSTFYAQITRQ